MRTIQIHHHGLRRGFRDERAVEGRHRSRVGDEQPIRYLETERTERHGGRGSHDRRFGDCGDRGDRGGRGEFGGRGGRGGPGDFGGGRHGGERGEGGGRRGRDGAGRRVLGRGELPLVILALLNEAPRHGYEIIRSIETRCLGAYSPSAGVIYPTLTMLEEQALTQADPTSEIGKRRYAITQAGREYIAEQQSAIQDAFARMDQVARMRARAALPDRVAQAMEGLKVALLRQETSWDDPQDIERVAAILETAAAALADAQAQAQVEGQAKVQAEAQAQQSSIAPDVGQQP